MVNDGQEAVEAARAQSFDLILMDISMPVMDGTTALSKIRAEQLHAGQPETPIVAVTANAMPHQMAEYAVAGFASCVAKPFDLSNLRRVLAELQPPLVRAAPSR